MRGPHAMLRSKIRVMRRALRWTVGLALVGSCVFSVSLPALAQEKKPEPDQKATAERPDPKKPGTRTKAITPGKLPVNDKEQRTLIHVEGMECANCSAKIMRAVKKLDGVRKVEVHVDRKIVVVDYKYSPYPRRKEIARAIQAAGFPKTRVIQ